MIWLSPWCQDGSHSFRLEWLLHVVNSEEKKRSLRQSSISLSLACVTYWIPVRQSSAYRVFVGISFHGREEKRTGMSKGRSWAAVQSSDSTSPKRMLSELPSLYHLHRSDIRCWTQQQSFLFWYSIPIPCHTHTTAWASPMVEVGWNWIMWGQSYINHLKLIPHNKDEFNS